MKALEKNISRHENGTLYFVSRRNGKLIRVSLGTKKLEQARKEIARLASTSLADKATFAQSPAPALVVSRVDLPVAPPFSYSPKSLADILNQFLATRVYRCKGTENMYEGASSNVLKRCKSLERFSPSKIWKEYRASGIEKVGHEYGSGCNHLRWFLRKFVPWAVAKGYLPSSIAEDLKEIPLVKVNPRRVRIPVMAQVEEFLQMVASEDKEAEVFLRFLICTGLRLRGANNLTWPDIDLSVPQMVIRQKGGRDVVIPMTPEAVEVLQSRKGKAKPFGFDQPKLDRIENKMKKFSKGLELDLTYYHSFRHYFASICLMSGLGVQEVARLLGHTDNGVLVLRTYGHLCSNYLRNAVAGLRLAKAA